MNEYILKLNQKNKTTKTFLFFVSDSLWINYLFFLNLNLSKLVLVWGWVEEDLTLF